MMVEMMVKEIASPRINLHIIDSDQCRNIAVHGTNGVQTFAIVFDELITAHLLPVGSGIPLTIPICEYLGELLKIRKQRRPTGAYVFPSRGVTGRMTDLKWPLKAVSLMGGKLIMCHDLRRTFLTICEELDIGVMTRKKLVNHSQGGDVTAGYTQVSMSKMRKATQAVADYIENSQGLFSSLFSNMGTETVITPRSVISNSRKNK